MLKRLFSKRKPTAEDLLKKQQELCNMLDKMQEKQLKGAILK